MGLMDIIRVLWSKEPIPVVPQEMEYLVVHLQPKGILRRVVRQDEATEAFAKYHTTLREVLSTIYQYDFQTELRFSDDSFGYLFGHDPLRVLYQAKPWQVGSLQMSTNNALYAGTMIIRSPTLDLHLAGQLLDSLQQSSLLRSSEEMDEPHFYVFHFRDNTEISRSDVLLKQMRYTPKEVCRYILAAYGRPAWAEASIKELSFEHHPETYATNFNPNDTFRF